MKKKGLISILVFVGLMTTVLIIIGMMFEKEEFEKQRGRTSIYDISANGTIAYVFYDEGHPGIYLANNRANPNDPIIQLPINQEILDISFSTDGGKLAYVIGHKDKRKDLKSAIHVFNMKTDVDQELIKEETLITEIEYHPTNPDLIFYLKAGTFQNYSPIASARPHDFDLYSYQLSNGKTKKHTSLKKYMMRSLRISETENVAYVTMDDDAEAETAEDIFATHQRIFQISLNESKAYQVVSDQEKDADIYDFAVTPDNGAFIFQSVANSGEDGVFQYELFLYQRQSGEESQLTHLEEHTSNPVIGPDGKTVYFMVDKQFGQRETDYHLYQMNLDGSNLEEAKIYMK